LAHALLPAHPGHHEVDQDYVRFRFFDALESSNAVWAANDVKPLIFEQKIYDIEGGQIVINNQYSVCHG
jgi:hypothetical protein